MSRISNIELIELGDKEDEKSSPWSSTILLMKLTTSDGFVGYGEAPTTLMTLSVFNQMKEIRRILKNKDPTEIEANLRDIYKDSFYMPVSIETTSAYSAFEIASMDLFGKMYGLPIYKMLGGKINKKIRAYSNGWYADCIEPEDFVKKSKQILKQGISGLKFDPFGSNFDTINSQSIKNAENIVGLMKKESKGIDLMIEFHGRFNANNAIKAAQPLQKFNPLFMEEPVHPDQFEGLLRFRNVIKSPIALGERVLSRSLFLKYLLNNIVDIIQPDVTNCRGISEAKKIAELADLFGIEVAFHNAFGPIQTAATLNIDLTIPNFLIQESFELSWPKWKKKLLTSGYSLEDGYFTMDNKPGLGIKINEKVLEEYKIKGKMELFDSNAPSWVVKDTFKSKK